MHVATKGGSEGRTGGDGWIQAGRDRRLTETGWKRQKADRSVIMHGAVANYCGILTDFAWLARIWRFSYYELSPRVE